jgi:hypothetical protein
LNFQLGDKAGEVVALTASVTADPIKEGLDQLDFSSEDPSNNLTVLEGIQQQITERQSELGTVLIAVLTSWRMKKFKHNRPVFELKTLILPSS